MKVKLRRLLLDYDIVSMKEVEEDAKRLNEKYNLGGYLLEASDTSECYHIIFPKTAFETFEEAFEIAKESKCDKEWLMFCERYKTFALKTVIAKKFQPHAVRKVCSKPVEKIPSPVILIVKPKNRIEFKRVLKLCESTHDKTWVWKVETPIIGIYGDREFITNILIGCLNERQADRRAAFLRKLEIDATFEVRISGKKSEAKEEEAQSS